MSTSISHLYPSHALSSTSPGRTTVETEQIYVALFPCNECAKLIIQSGIREVVYLSDKVRRDKGEGERERERGI